MTLSPPRFRVWDQLAPTSYRHLLRVTVPAMLTNQPPNYRVSHVSLHLTHIVIKCDLIPHAIVTFSHPLECSGIISGTFALSGALKLAAEFVMRLDV